MKAFIPLCRKCPDLMHTQAEDGHPDWIYLRCKKFNGYSFAHGVLFDNGIIKMRDFFEVPEDCTFKLEHIMKHDSKHETGY